MKRALLMMLTIACIFMVTDIVMANENFEVKVFKEDNELYSEDKINIEDVVEIEPEKPLSRALSMPSIDKWMYDENYVVAHWLGEKLGGKTIWEPINIIFMDGFATSSSNSRSRMRTALSDAQFPHQGIHSDGYHGKMDGIWYNQEPTENDQAFSDGSAIFTNNHGRMFGPRKKEDVYYWIGAFSRESGTFHHYISFNTARNTLANNLNSYTSFKKGESKYLGNKYNTSTDTTGDHDGYAILIAAQDPYESDNSFGSANWISNGEEQKHSISPKNDVDYCKFSISGTKDVTIETSGPYKCDTRMWLYNSSQSQIAYNDDGGTGYYSKITKSLGSGTYYIKIDEYGQSNLIPLYKLKLTVTGGGGGSYSVSTAGYWWPSYSFTSTGVTGDDSYKTISLPFTFSFYGVNHNSVKISSNGYLTFGSDGTDYSPDAIPNSKDPNDFIAPLWRDLNPSKGGSIKYYSSSSLFIVRYENVPNYGNSNKQTFQVEIYKSGVIYYDWKSVTNDKTTTIGVENPSGSAGTPWTSNPTNEGCIRFTYSGKGSPVDEERERRIAMERDGNLPKVFALSQNLPNPFSDRTTIRFTLPKESNVSLKIYNVNGQLIKTLVNGHNNAGNYSVKWDGKDDNEKDVSKGIYFYRIEAGAFSEIKKMIMIK
ncbi:T9SS type A sorting domain-containing protein [candidate division WOR-3 bacterium]|nr:T9SS type A sorting domain-containing protein [candidate division WOR-3 bacterium]